MNETGSRLVLLVDDEAADAHLVRLAIKENGIRAAVRHAVDGREALEFLRDGAHPRPSLILLDLNMPRMNGLECLAALKQDAALADIPVVVLTTSGAARDSLAARAAGAADFITKPIDVLQFFAAIRSLNRYLQ
jgi:CheY-like chemotaxis protein